MAMMETLVFIGYVLRSFGDREAVIFYGNRRGFIGYKSEGKCYLQMAPMK